jgi:bifunctional DNA-binding transcriptional regulator/antitoxin component of YhaV-PrlF toxin-antitoxin module
MTRIPSLALPGRITTPDPERMATSPVPMGLPPLRDLGAADGPRLSIALMDGGGRLQDRGAVAALGWSPGDRLLITLVRTSVVIRRRPDGVFVMPRKPYVALPAPVRRGCGALAGSRLLLVADPIHDVLIVHPEAAMQAMLRTFHTSLAAPEEAS